MSAADIALPAGCRLARFESLDSTNAEALRRAQAGEGGDLWVWARAQTAGRGRFGRAWRSLPGNLHASLLLRLACPLDTARQLALVAGLAIHDAVTTLAAGRLGQPLALKWPNDLLLDRAKLGGVLLESASGPAHAGCVVAIGTGLNLAAHPADAAIAATDLSRHGPSVTPEKALTHLARATEARLQEWREGAGFAAIRAAWEARAIPLGQPIRVRHATHEEAGTYGGIDADGALRLIAKSGTERRVSAGEVFMVQDRSERGRLGA